MNETELQDIEIALSELEEYCITADRFLSEMQGVEIAINEAE